MMDRTQAIAYGKRIGCKFYVYTDRGGLLGGFKTMESAERCKAEWEQEIRNNPWDNTMKVYIVTK